MLILTSYRGSLNADVRQKMKDSESWFAVRCLFEHPTRKKEGEDHLYEERTTLWRATSFEDAHAQAEEESKNYAAEDDCIFIRVSDSFKLFDETIEAGTEVFSTMRGSNMDPELYQKTYCCTPYDRALKAPSFAQANKPEDRTMPSSESSETLDR